MIYVGSLLFNEWIGSVIRPFRHYMCMTIDNKLMHCDAYMRQMLAYCKMDKLRLKGKYNHFKKGISKGNIYMIIVQKLYIYHIIDIYYKRIIDKYTVNCEVNNFSHNTAHVILSWLYGITWPTFLSRFGRLYNLLQFACDISSLREDEGHSSLLH